MKRLFFKECEKCGKKVKGIKRTDRKSYTYPKRCKECHGYKHRSRENNSQWKGGIRKHQEGYVIMIDPRLPNSITRGKALILEHRYVMECHLGRKLKTKEVVHHLNGIRDDNRIENLSLIPEGDFQETWTLVKLQRERIKALEKEIHKLEVGISQK